MNYKHFIEENKKYSVGRLLMKSKIDCMSNVWIKDWRHLEIPKTNDFISMEKDIYLDRWKFPQFIFPHLWAVS